MAPSTARESHNIIQHFAHGAVLNSLADGGFPNAESWLCGDEWMLATAAAESQTGPHGAHKQAPGDGNDAAPVSDVYERLSNRRRTGANETPPRMARAQCFVVMIAS
jgi:hypothetical protein